MDAHRAKTLFCAPTQIMEAVVGSREGNLAVLLAVRLPGDAGHMGVH